ncbi:MAG: hypothetical protein JXQ29_13955, partial [Planctomycetes bacterium]|nr:hypothetical protein [Planctomycetota bacterium]
YGYGRGFGRGGRGGYGGGWRHRNWYYATGLPAWQRGWTGWAGPGAALAPGLSREQELEVLRQQAIGFERTLAELKARIQELEKPTTSPDEKESR